MPAPVTRRTAAPLVLRLFFVVALLFTAIGLIESVFIAYDLFTGSLSAQRAPDLGLGIRSWTEHHAMRPGYDIPPVRTNSFGLRSPEVAVPKPAGTPRILLLGDSFTFGFKAADADVFARQMERLFRTTYGLPSLEVVNAGVLSYCPLLEYLQYKHHLQILEPDLVVLNFDMSDVQDHLDYSRSLVSSADGEPLFVTEPSLRQGPTRMPSLLSFEWFTRHFKAAQRRFESSEEGLPSVRDEDRYLWAVDGGPDMDAEVAQTLAPILFLDRLLKHYRIPLILATYPQPWQVSADATPLPPVRDQFRIGRHTVHLNDRPFRKLDRFAAQHGIPFFNATSAFRAGDDPARLFLADDFHFSRRGNALYASLLADYLVTNRLIRPVPAPASSR